MIDFKEIIKSKQQIKANELRMALIAKGFLVSQPSTSITKFGVSTYIGFYDEFYVYRKFRISDHSVINIDRIFNEYHYNENSDVNDIILRVERDIEETEKRNLERKKINQLDDERTELCNNKWEIIKDNFVGLSFKKNDRTYQNLEEFSKNKNRSNIFQKALSLNKMGEMAYSYEWTEPINSNELPNLKPSREFIEQYVIPETLSKTELIKENQTKPYKMSENAPSTNLMLYTKVNGDKTYKATDLKGNQMKETVTNTELGKAMYDLDKAEKLQQTMKTANSIIRSKKNVTERLVSEAGMSESTAIKIQQPDYAGRVGCATYQLTNNNASIKRLQERVKMLQKKVEGAKAAESGAEEKYTFDGGIIKVNYDEDRVQILLDSVRADRALYQKFRKNGYVFSPTNKAFQRKITPQAIRNAVQLMDAVKVESSKEIVPEEVVNDKKYIRLNRYFNGIPEDTIGEVIEKPNMFVTRVKFGDKIHTIDNGFLSKVEKEQKLRFPKLPYNHPLNILDENSNQYKEALAEERIKFDVTEPNTGDEFDEVIMSNIDPKDSWKGNLMKERDVKRQIYSQLTGLENEKEIEVERIFNLYASKFEGDLHKLQSNSIPQDVLDAAAIINEVGPSASDAGTEDRELYSKALKTLEKSDYRMELGELIKKEPNVVIQETIIETSEAFKGINFDYKNQYELNKAIEALLTDRPDSEYSSDTKNFIRKYSGYGGLDKYGKTGKGGLFEYYTPREVIEKMWALAYKYGYNNGSVIEPSVATGEFLQFAKPETRIVGYEINEYSAKICKILYPTAEIHLQPFEQLFIKNNWTMKDNISSLEKFDLAIGNPPYGDFSIVESRYMSGMGEKDHTKSRNYVEYFIRRSLDLLKPKGLLVFIVGAQVKNGGNLFLDSGNSPVKEYLNEKCTFLDAYRLPDSIFERTGVTSEIIVLQKN